MYSINSVNGIVKLYSFQGPKCNFAQEDELEEEVVPETSRTTSPASKISNAINERIGMLASTMMPLLKQLAADPKTNIRALGTPTSLSQHEIFSINNNILQIGCFWMYLV